jgi:predicted amidohydrolase YtcJ
MGQTPNADVILHNGVILTMDQGKPTASAIRIQGEKIVSVGEDDEVLAEAGLSTTVIDLGGLTLMPGFVDAHSHMFQEPDPDVVQETLLRTGITTTAEMYVDEPLLQRLIELDAGAALRVRLSAYLLYDTSCGDPLGDWWRAYPATRVPGEMLRIGGVKVFTDGGSCNAPAVTFEYANGIGQGDLYFTQPELEEALRSIDGAGYQAAVHAIGDRALDGVLGAFENLWGGDNPRRHRIEHNAVIRPDQLARYNAAQPVAVIFAPFATCHKLGAGTRFKYDVPDEYRTWEWPWRDLIDANPGLQLAWHGDMPHVYPPDLPYQLWAMVTRAELADDGSICQPPDWIAHNALSVDEALHLMTVGAAYALDRDQEVGSLVAGKYADLIVLSQNPRTIPPLDLKGLQVLMTMVGGRFEYCADGMQTLCPEISPAALATDAAPTAALRDDFDGALHPSWSWLRQDPTAWSLEATPGWLRIDLSTTGYLSGSPSNVLVQAAPSGDFELQTRVRLSPARNFELAGLVVLFDDGSLLQFGRGFCDLPGCAGAGFYFDNLQNRVSVGGNFASPDSGGADDRLRLVRRGDTYTAYRLADDATWIEIGSHTVDRPPQSVGLIAAQAPSPGSVAEFDYFEVTR